MGAEEASTGQLADREKAVPVLERFRDFILGPTRFMNLLSCFELGIIDVLRTHPNIRMTPSQLASQVDVSESAIAQLLQLLVKEDFLSHDEESNSYALDGLAYLSDEDLTRVVTFANMIKVVCLRQLYYLTESVRAGKPVGLKQLYGFDGIFYDACVEHEDLRAAWAPLMDHVISQLEPWFFSNFDIPPNSKVLDVAGNTGVGAILTHQLCQAPGLHVTCFDVPAKEAEALQNFKDAGLEHCCAFVGGDVFDGLPQGFDLVLIQHFLDMFDEENVRQILSRVHEALNPGGQLCVMTPIYSDNVKDGFSVDFFPAYMLGCTMGQGGPQKLSTYERWLESCGFKVTKAISQDTAKMPPDTIRVRGMLCATKI
jgi:2-polyprenyl-3-methyl-5-hydroxy-6-metoxy-1,4-benzoquinol methylase